MIISLSEKERKEARIWREKKYFDGSWQSKALFKMHHYIPNVYIYDWKKWLKANKKNYPEHVIEFLKGERTNGTQ